MGALRVVLADDNFLVREGVAKLLAEIDDLELVASVEDAQALLAAVAEHRPDAVLTDIRMPPTHTTEGIEAAKQIRIDYPDVGVVVLSQYVEEDYAFDLLADGVAGLGYLLKERISDRAQIVNALTAVASGGSVVDAKVIDALIGARARNETSPLAALTPREREILAEIAQGKTNQTIAAELFLTKRAVEKHINAIFSKLGLSNDDDVSRRVKATLIHLAGAEQGSEQLG